MSQQLGRKHGLRRDQNGGNLPWSMVPLFEVEEGVGEVDHVFMAIDVGHGDRAKE